MHETTERLYKAALELKNIAGQSAVANFLNASPQTVNNWEKRGVSDKGMIAAAKLLGCSVIWLKTGIGEMLDNRDSNNPPVTTLNEEPAAYQAEKQAADLLPLLDLNKAVQYVNTKDPTLLKNADRVATTITHTSNAFAVRMIDNSMRSDIDRDESIWSGDILIAEPQMEPEHNDIVIVSLDEKRHIGMVAKLKLDAELKSWLHRPGKDIIGENPIPMPTGAYICGVVIELKRRLISQSQAAGRINEDWDIKNTLVKK